MDDGSSQSQAFNRTIVELKCCIYFKKLTERESFNRTIVELKYKCNKTFS